MKTLREGLADLALELREQEREVVRLIGDVEALLARAPCGSEAGVRKLLGKLRDCELALHAARSVATVLGAEDDANGGPAAILPFRLR